MTLNSKIKKTYIIAEAGVNHNGNFSLAKKMIKTASDCGADAIKFQIFKAEDLSTSNTAMAPYQKKNLKKNISQFSMLKKLELKSSDYIKLKKYSKKKKIDFLVSVFDEKSLDYFEKKLKCKIIKIPSGEITNYFLLKKINYKKYNIILSTGMSNLKEISDALNIISKKKIFITKGKKIITSDKKRYSSIRKKIFLLHCVTDYPANEKYLNINSIETLIKEFDLITGYSDHSIGTLASSLAVAKGAKIIEKHFTLNRNMSGPDHSSSLDPNQFKEFVKNIRVSKIILGKYEKKIQKSEIPNMKLVRKSIVALNQIEKNEKMTLKNLTAKRAVNGISPMNIKKILNKKAKKKYIKDEIVL